MTRPLSKLSVAFVLSCASLLGVAAGSAPPPVTADNLRAAFEDDARAEARYRAFANRADRDGQQEEAALFRAAAHAEGVRARLLSGALRRLGAEPGPPAPAEAHLVRPTRGNVLATLAHENAERAAEYPRYVDQARRDALPDAVLAFTLAHHANAALVALVQDAVVGRWSTATGSALHVCETCGYVVRGDPPDRCPVSLSPRAAFTRVP